MVRMTFGFCSFVMRALRVLGGIMLGLVLGIVALICVIVHIMNRCPLWVPVLILSLIPIFGYVVVATA